MCTQVEGGNWIIRIRVYICSVNAILSSPNEIEPSSLDYHVQYLLALGIK